MKTGVTFASGSRRHLLVWTGVLLFSGAASAAEFTFQQGAAGYTGAVDGGIEQGSPGTSLATATSMTVDLGSASAAPATSVSAILIRFDSIFGAGAGQIPSDLAVTQATLTFNVVDAGSGFRVFDMLEPWADSITWAASFGTSGFPEPGVGAAALPVVTIGSDVNAANVPTGKLTLDVTASVVAAQNGALPGYGWVLQPWPNAGYNGVDVSTSEAEAVANRPLLAVTAVPEPSAQALLAVGLAGFLALARRRPAPRN